MQLEGCREGHRLPLRHPRIRGDERGVSGRVQSRLPGTLDPRGATRSSGVPCGDRGHRLSSQGNLRVSFDLAHLLKEVRGSILLAEKREGARRKAGVRLTVSSVAALAG